MLPIKTFWVRKYNDCSSFQILRYLHKIFALSSFEVLLGLIWDPFGVHVASFGTHLGFLRACMVYRRGGAFAY